MKTPRIKDFESNPAPALGSPMDDMPAITPRRGAATPSVRDPDQNLAIPNDANATTSSVRPYVRTGIRLLKRQPFEFYQDQLDALKEFALEEKSRGEKGSMSEMAREAFDVYITK